MNKKIGGISMKENSQLDFMLYFKQTFSDLLYFKEKYHIDYSVRFVVKLLDLALHIMEIYENNEHLEYVSSNFLKKIYSSNTSGEYKIISADITIVDSLMFDISNIEDDILITDKLNSFKAILVRYLG